MSSIPKVHFLSDSDHELSVLSLHLLTSGAYVQFHNHKRSLFKSVCESEYSGCLIVDVPHRGMSGAEIVSKLRAVNGALSVIVITSHTSVDDAVEALKLGAFDVLSKPVDNRRLEQVVHAALDRRRATSNEIRRRDAATRIASLSRRYRQVLDGVADGLSAKMIAHDLGISPRTVELHKKKMLQKLGVKSVAVAIRLLVESSLGDCTGCRLPDCPGRERKYEKTSIEQFAQEA